MPLSQDNRPLAVTTPLGKDVLLLRRFTGHEAMSQLFSFELDLLSEVAPAIAFDKIVGKSVTISVTHGGGTRYFNGIVSLFAQGANEGTLSHYRAEVVPAFWLLTRRAGCRIFQRMTVPDIITKVLNDAGLSDVRIQVEGRLIRREFCVQYRETDFHFVSRLLEQYGFYYFFEHGNGRHTMVIANTPASYQPCVPGAVMFQHTMPPAPAPSSVVHSWEPQQEIRPGKWSMTDYNFETPDVSLAVTANSAVPNPKLEIYDYPGEYFTKPEGEAVVKVRMEEEDTFRRRTKGASSCPQFIAGGTFTISGNSRPDLDGSYVLTSVTHSATEPGYTPAGGATRFTYDNGFVCIPSAVPFRPARTTPRPVVQGSQTAEVVGPAAQEIHTDKFGRVKVQFHWDREGKRDENSSAWIRVSHPWAGQNWGTIVIPRIGQEVIVDFLEGDPDQPIITGRVYNAEQMPPYPLPAGAAVSGTRSNATKGGGGFNELSLDDTKGKERITIHAERDLQTTVGHDRAIAVGANDSTSVGHNQTETVGSNQTITVGADRTLMVSKDETITVQGGRMDQVAKDDKLAVGKNLVITTGDSISITTGDASLTMKKDGTIVLKGKNISITGSGAVTVKADGDVVINGSKIGTN